MTVQFINQINPIDGTEFVTVWIDHGNGEFTSMTLAEYEKEYPDAPKS